MNTRSGLTAAQLLELYAQNDLQRVFRQYGELKNAGRIASLIVKAREGDPVRQFINPEDENATLTRPHYMEFRYGFMREVYMSKENEPSYAFGASGGHALFDRKKFLQLGGFDEIYSPFYYEDADLSYRAWKRGYRVYYEPNSIVYHEHQATIGKSFSKRYIAFIFNRNRFIFLWKNLTDSKLIFQHCLFIPVYLLYRSFKNPFIFLSFLAALVKLPSVFIARKKEKAFIRYGDREVLEFIGEK